MECGMSEKKAWGQEYTLHRDGDQPKVVRNLRGQTFSSRVEFRHPPIREERAAAAAILSRARGQWRVGPNGEWRPFEEIMRV